MAVDKVTMIEAHALATRLATEVPDNFDPRRGFALVCVSESGIYESGHIPGGVNIPRGLEEAFEERYDRSKEIVLYCEDEGAAGASSVGGWLARQGYARVAWLEGGLPAWRRAGGALENGSQWGRVGEQVRRVAASAAPASDGSCGDFPVPPVRL